MTIAGFLLNKSFGHAQYQITNYNPQTEVFECTYKSMRHTDKLYGVLRTIERNDKLFYRALRRKFPEEFI